VHRAILNQVVISRVYLSDTATVWFYGHASFESNGDSRYDDHLDITQVPRHGSMATQLSWPT
jgi:hypothetical protein